VNLPKKKNAATW